MNARLALYSEYVGSDRKPSTRRMYAVAENEEAMQSVIDSLPSDWPQMKWRVEDFETGKTLLTF